MNKHLLGSSLLALLALVLTAPGALANSAPPATAAPVEAAPPSPGEAAFQFSLAKTLAEEGRVLEALQVFPEAIRLVPDDPYVRIEYAELLLRVAQRFAGGNGRVERLSEAVDQAEEARRLAPENLDVLRLLAQAELALAELRPAALSTAIEAMEAVRRQAPYDVQTMVTLGQLYMQQDKPDKAAEVFAELATYTPGNRMIYSFLTDALRAAGRDVEAEEPLRKLLDIDPRSVDSRVTLAKLLAHRGDHAGAVALLRAAPAEVADSRDIRSELVWQLFQSGELDEALAAADAEVAADSTAVWPRFVRALVYSGLGRNDEALAELTTLRSDDPDNLDLARTTAGVLERTGKPDQAAGVLRDLVTRLDAADPPVAEAQRARARLLLAGVQARAGHREEAAATLAPLLTSGDEDVRSEASLSYADLLFELGRRDAALSLLEDGADDLPVLRAKELELLLRADDERRARKLVTRIAKSEDADLLVLAAQAAQSQQNYELSLPLLERALVEDSGRVEANFLAGAAYERTGQRDQAVTAFRRVLDLDRDFAPALNYLGYMWVEKGENLTEALGLVERAVALDPENGAYVDSLGWAHYQLGDYSEAREQLERAANLLPEDPTIAEHLADVYVALGLTARAQELYRRALDLAAGDAADVRRKLDRLQVD